VDRTAANALPNLGVAIYVDPASTSDTVTGNTTTP